MSSATSWHIDENSLLPVIDDLEAFRREFKDDPVADVLIHLWSGRPRQAEDLLGAMAPPASSFRLRALLADAWRDQGHYDDAIAAYRDLVAATAGTPREAVMRQHLGKVYFVCGEYSRALECFEEALELRVREKADADLMASSQLAVGRATEILKRPGTGDVSRS
ncbi:tetratricopeptide repeat protein [Zhihengliuella halotolerans]|uniref:tetratricopeptide repeat protein n=1 Tax=Zhihengliuella halotolerans TaxID=370736 RepID=UPI000C7FBB19|nr:tetratricopeptide repeat protein [Zhihengliuella halotolerans]